MAGLIQDHITKASKLSFPADAAEKQFITGLAKPQFSFGYIHDAQGRVRIELQRSCPK